MPKGYTNGMNRKLHAMIGLVVLLACFVGPDVSAQHADTGVEAAVNLLKDATSPQRGGSHSNLLLGLRQLEDPALLPLFQGLRGSPYLSMRIHGQLGSAALSPQRRIDLSALAEIEDQRELVQVLSAAIDDELIDNNGMATLLTWDGLDLPLHQAIALRLMAAGGKVDTKPFHESLAVDLNDELSASKLLQYALAGLLLAEAGDEAGQAALGRLDDLRGDNADAVIGQALDASMRQGFTAAGKLGLSIANDDKRNEPLRLLAIQSAMRLKAPGATEAWQAMFRSEENSVTRIRLAMIALDAAEQVEPAFFDTLADQGSMIAGIAKAGRAIAERQDDLGSAFNTPAFMGQPISVQWVASYCRRVEPEQGPDLLELVIQDHGRGLDHHRGRMIQASIDATAVLCELYPEAAEKRLIKLLTDNSADDNKQKLKQRQIILMGIANARSGKLKPLAQAIDPDQHNDFTTEALRLFIRSRHGASLTASEWRRASDIVQGVGQLGHTMRLQLGWAYLKHMGKTEQAIAEALR